MRTEEQKKLLEQDIEDIKGLINYKQDGMTEDVVKQQARAILLNLQEHFEPFIHSKK